MTANTSRSVWVDFKEVREKVSIPDVLSHYKLLEEFTEKNGKWRGQCPLPQHVHQAPIPNRNGFSIDRNKDVWLYRCWGDCKDQPWGAGDVIAFVCAMEQYGEGSEALRLARLWFAKHFGDVLSLRRPKNESSQTETKKAREDTGQRESPQAVSEAPDILADDDAPLKPLRWQYQDLDPAAEYLKSRGITPETAKHFGFGLLRPKPDKRRAADGYICFPAYRLGRENGECPVGYQGRYDSESYVEEDKPRYMNWFDVGKAVFGINEALAASGELPLIITEGCFKAAWLYQCGFPTAVSTFTSTVTDTQAELLASTKRPLLIFFDGDHAGFEGARLAVAKLSYLAYVRRLRVPAGKSPDDLSQTELQELLARLTT